MKTKNIFRKLFVLPLLVVLNIGCEDKLHTPPENTSFTSDIDYSDISSLRTPLLGAYQAFATRGWEDMLLLSVRGDDVNAGGKGDQVPYTDTDNYIYNVNYWMYNSLWEGIYEDVLAFHSTMEQYAKFKDSAPEDKKPQIEQYIAEAKVLRAFLLLQLSRTWGGVLLPESSDSNKLKDLAVTPKKEVMNHLIAQMDESIKDLSDIRPNEREDIRGGVTKYTALAIKAMATQENKDYINVAKATGEIISSGKFTLESDFYELFKIKGKLNDENLLEFQYSDYGAGQGDNFAHLYAPYGPQKWTPVVGSALAGWGFYEPSMKYIKFMLDRGETTRLETSVLFTNRGIAELKKDANYATLPSFVNNTTRDGDEIGDYARALFASGKHYLPSNQLTPGRTEYGENKNYTCIRYAEILLMYAEAVMQGGTATAISALEAVNMVRTRAGLLALTNLTLDNVIDEKYAELAMEWGIRFYDMTRLGKGSELSYDGRTFTKDKTYLPYPQKQVDLIPSISN